jgi:nitroreductase
MYIYFMNFFDVVFTRSSVRKFQKKDIDERLIGLILYCATKAPSSGNVQDWEFVVVKDEKIKEKIAIASLHQMFIKEAPVVIVVCSDLEKVKLRYGERGEKLYSIQNTAAATMIILLAAKALGLGSCWVGAFDEDRIKEILNLPPRVRPVAIIPIGYPEGEGYKTERIPFENLTWLNQYGKKYEIEMKNLGELLKSILKKKNLKTKNN